MNREILDSQLEYWLEQEKAAQKALEYAQRQIHSVRCDIGTLVVKAMQVDSVNDTIT